MSVEHDKPKTFKKEELEQIAKQLKNKLSKATLTAKSNGTPRKSPLRGFKKHPNSSPVHNGILSSSPQSLYSPNGKSPTHIKTPAAIYLSSSPLKNMVEDGSPTKKKRVKRDPQMILHEISRPTTPTKQGLLQPSLDMKVKPANDEADDEDEKEKQTTPVLSKRDMNTPSVLLRTPTQSKGSNYNDEEGADLLMYLATSPSPAKPYYGNTPRASSANSRSNGFVAPPPPMTPKRHNMHSNKTPQRTPQVNLFLQATNNNQNGVTVTSNTLPSAGLTLTPNGFNMNDYVNFFTPSPSVAPGSAGVAAAQAQAQALAQAQGMPFSSSMTRNLLKTPDFYNLVGGTPKKVDGRLLNFNEQQGE